MISEIFGTPLDLGPEGNASHANIFRYPELRTKSVFWEQKEGWWVEEHSKKGEEPKAGKGAKCMVMSGN